MVIYVFFIYRAPLPVTVCPPPPSSTTRHCFFIISRACMTVWNSYLWVSFLWSASHETISTTGQGPGLICCQLCPQCLPHRRCSICSYSRNEWTMDFKTGLRGPVEFSPAQQLQMGKLRLAVVKSLAGGFCFCSLFIHTTYGSVAPSSFWARCYSNGHNSFSLCLPRTWSRAILFLWQTWIFHPLHAK